MNTEKKLSVKDHGNPTEKHVSKAMQRTRDKRQDRMIEKRKEQSKPQDNLKSLIASFPVQEFLSSSKPIVILTTLVKILRDPASNQYYAESILYDNDKNTPYLFQNELVMKHLVSFLNTSQDIELVRLVCDALVCVSAHEEQLTWSWELVRWNIIPYGLAIMDKCPDVKIKEKIICVFGNLMADNIKPRMRILQFKGFPEIFMRTVKLATDPAIMDMASFLFNTMLLDEISFELVKPIWDFMLQQYHSNDERVLAVLLCGIARGAKMNCDEFRMDIVSKDFILDFLMNPKTQNESILKIIADIMSSLVWTRATHEKLIQKGIVNLYGIFLNHRELVIREQGCVGLSVLVASSPVLVEKICENKQLLDAIQRQFFVTQITRVWNKVHMIMFNIIMNTNLSKYYDDLIVQRQWDNQITKVIGNNYNSIADPVQLYFALQATLALLKYKKKETLEKLEETDSMTYIDQFAMTHKDPDVRRLAGIIVEKGDLVDMELD